MNDEPTAKLTEPTTDDNRAATRAESTANEKGAGKESSSATPHLLMFNAGDADACTADSCTVTIQKG